MELTINLAIIDTTNHLTNWSRVIDTPAIPRTGDQFRITYRENWEWADYTITEVWWDASGAIHAEIAIEDWDLSERGDPRDHGVVSGWIEEGPPIPT